MSHQDLLGVKSEWICQWSRSSQMRQRWYVPLCPPSAGQKCWICPLWIVSSLLSLIRFWLINKQWVCLPAQTFLTPQFCTLQTETSCSNRSLIHLTAIKDACMDYIAVFLHDKSDRCWQGWISLRATWYWNIQGSSVMICYSSKSDRHELSRSRAHSIPFVHQHWISLCSTVLLPNEGGSLVYWFTCFHFLATFILGVHPITGSILEHSIGSSNNLVVTPGIVLNRSWKFWKLYVLYKSEDSARAGHQQNPILQASSILPFIICLQCQTYSSTSPFTTLTVSLNVHWCLWTKMTLN